MSARTTPIKIFTHWLTRSSDPETGALDDRVSVWLSQPKRESLGERGCFWMPLHPSPGLDDHYGMWTIDECLANHRVYPDDDRQSIRCGPESDIRRPGEAVEPPTRGS